MKEVFRSFAYCKYKYEYNNVKILKYKLVLHSKYYLSESTKVLLAKMYLKYRSRSQFGGIGSRAKHCFGQAQQKNMFLNEQL